MTDLDVTNPVYFPFTRLPATSADRLRVCFDRATLFALSDDPPPADITRWPEPAKIDIRIPVRTEAPARMMRTYRSWIESHRGGVRDYLKARRMQIPFFDDHSLSRILSDIRRADIRTATAMPKKEDNADNGQAERLLRSVLFLRAAEDYDAQIETVSDRFNRFKQMEHAFYAGLNEANQRPADVSTPINPVQPEDAGSFMTADRILAWSRLLQCDSIDSPLFVTDSSAVMNELLNASIHLIRVMVLDCLPVSGSETVVRRHLSDWKPRFLNCLASLAKLPKGFIQSGLNHPGPVPVHSDGRRSIAFTLWMAPGWSPKAYFKRLADFSAKDRSDSHDKQKTVNTLIGLLTG